MTNNRWILAMLLAVIMLPIGCAQEKQSGIVIEKFPICTENAEQSSPAISGNIVVWLDKRDGIYGIYGYDLLRKNEFVIRKDRGKLFYNADSGPDISGDIVVWQEYSEGSGYDIWNYDLKTNIAMPISSETGNQIMPKVGGNFIFWLDKYNYTHLAGYDMSTRKAIDLPDKFWPQSFDVSNNLLVYSAGGIIGKNLISGETFTVGIGGTELDVNINGNIVAWIDKSATSPLWNHWRAGDVVTRDLTQKNEIHLSETWSYVSAPAASEDFVVWEDSRNDSGDIYGYDLSSGIEFPICIEEGHQSQASIDGNMVVWVDGNHGNGDIYGARILRGSE